jgi:GntR family transcriptional regulator
VLLQKLREGHWPVGQPLPSEPVLADNFEVSRDTIRRALQLLSSDGLIERRRGRGTFPLSQSFTPETPKVAAHRNELNSLIFWPEGTSVRRVRQDRVIPPRSVIEFLDLCEREKCHVFVRARTLDKKPYSISYLYITDSLVRAAKLTNRGDEPLLVTLEDRGFKPNRAEQSIGASLSDEEIARVMEMDLGMPMLKVSRELFDEAGKPLVFQVVLYPADNFEVRSTLSRSLSEPRQWTVKEVN